MPRERSLGLLVMRFILYRLRGRFTGVSRLAMTMLWLYARGY
jgi:hypothetical protein